MGVVRCGTCGIDNRESAKFCGECGSRLERICTQCTTPLAPGAKFCDECGTPAPGSTPAPVEVPDAARKLVTVAFVDLGGSTAFGEVVDAETTRTVMGRYHALVTDAVEAHGGTVAKYIGDGVMVFFGVPETGEDDAIRAVAFGAECQERFAPFAAAVLDRHGATVTLRVGINTGEIVIGDDDVDLYGDALNVAARLEKACPHGGVLVGEETWRLARTAFAFESQGSIDVHGRAGAVHPFLLQLDADVDDDAGPFVGRDDELARLRALFDRSVARRRPTLASVIGPPGVGKSRLSRELHASVEADGAAVVVATCDRAGEATLGPVADLLRAGAGFAADAAEVRSNLEARLGDVDDRDRIIEGLLAVIGLANKKISVEETFRSLRRLVEIVGAEAPLMIIVDDIQWASELLLDLFDHLVSFVDDTALCIVTLARPEIRDLRPEFAETGRPVDELVLLAGLDADATATLAARLLDTDELPRGLADRLPASTDGNPLFVREVVRMLVDEHVIRREPDPNGADRWVLAVEPDAIDVPPTIQSLLAARVERLPDPERRVLERAAVIGPDFTRNGLAHLCDPSERSSLPAILRSLTRQELIEPAGAFWGDDPIHRFHHVLIRDAVYRRLLKETRARMHEAIGAWMIDAAKDVVGDHGAAIGHHAEQAFRYRSELGDAGPDVDALGVQAASLLGDAAIAALRDDDAMAAGALVRRALHCLPLDHPDRPALLTLACESLLVVGDVAASRPFIDELRGLAALAPAFGGWADAYEADAIMVAEPDRLADAEALATSAVEAMADHDHPAGRAKAHLVRASILARRGRIGDCEAELDVALSEARAAQDTRRVVSVLGVAPLAALWGPSPVARAGGRCLDVLRLLRITASSPAVEAVALRCQSVLEALRGRFDTATTLIDRAHAAVAELGLRHELAAIAMARGQILLLAGDADAAATPLREALDELRSLGASAEASQAASLLGRSLLHQGRIEDVEALVDEAERLAGENLKAAILGRTVRAEWLSATGRLEEARTVAERAVAIAETTDLVLDHADASEVLGRFDAGAARRAIELRAQKGVQAERPAPRRADPTDDDLVRLGTIDPAAASTPAMRGIRRWMDGYNSGDRDALVAAFRPDVHLHNRRRVAVDGNTDPRGRDAIPVIVGVVASFPTSAFEGIAIAGTHLVLGRHQLGGPTGQLDLHIVSEHDDDGLVRRFAPFDVEDAQQARALFERWAGERREVGAPPGGHGRPDGSTDDAGRSGENQHAAAPTLLELFTAASTAAWNSGESERFADLMAPDLEVLARRSVVNAGDQTGEAAVETLVSMMSVAPTLEVVLQQSRSDDLGVRHLRFTGEHGLVEFRNANQIDHLGRLRRIATFDVEDVDGPPTMLDAWDAEPRRPVVDASTTAARMMAAWRDAWNDGDESSLRAGCAPTMLLSTNRRLGVDERHGADAIEANVGLARTFPHVHGSVVATPTDDVVLEHVRLHDDDGNELRMLALSVVEGDGRIAELRGFEVHDAERALAAMRAAAAVRQHESAPRLLTLVEVNARAMEDAFADGDPESVLALLADDVVVHGGRSTVTSGTIEAAEARAGALGLLDVADSLTVDIHETRRTDLAHVSLVYRGGGVEIPMRQVTQVNELGQITRMATFDPDQVVAAQRTLDAWDAELRWYGTDIESHVDSTFVRLLFAQIDAFWSGDVSRVDQLSAPDFSILAERDVGFLPREDAIGAMFDMAATFPRAEPRFLALPHPNVGLGHARLWNDDGLEIDMLMIYRFAPDGRCRAIFGVDTTKPGDALARLAEWAADATGEEPCVRHPAYGNLASFAWVYGTRARALAAEIAGVEGPARYGLSYDQMAPDVVRYDHRAVHLEPHGRDEWWAALTVLWDVGIHRVDFDVIAEVGDHVVVIDLHGRSETGDDLHLTAVLEVDEEGLLRRIDLFDGSDVERAQAWLTGDDHAGQAIRAGVAGDPADRTAFPEDHGISDDAANWHRDRVVDLWNRCLAGESIAAMSPPRCTMIDRRPLMANVLEGIEAVEAGGRAMGELAPNRRIEATATIRSHRDRVALLRLRMESDTWTSEWLNLTRFGVDGRWNLAVTFEPDDVAAAEDEFERLVAELPVGAFGARPAALDGVPTLDVRDANQNVRTAVALADHSASADLDAMAALLHPEVVVRSHRALLRHEAVGRDAVLAAWAEIAETAIGHGDREVAQGQAVYGVLAVAGDELCLGHDGMPGWNDQLTVSRVDAEGRVRRLDHFDVDALDDALASLHELASEAGVPVVGPDAPRGAAASSGSDRVAPLTFAFPALDPLTKGTPWIRLVHELERARVDDDHDALRRIFGETVVDNRHDAMTSGTLHGPDAVDGVLAAHDLFERWSVREVMAVRGQRLGLLRNVVRDVDDEKLSFLSVAETDESGTALVRMTNLSPDAVDDAIALLDEWHADQSDAVAADAIGVIGRELATATRDPGSAEHLDLLSDDVVFRFHDAGPWDELGLEEFLVVQESLLADVAHSQFWVVVAEPCSDEVVVAVQRRTATMADGTTAEWLWAITAVVDDGRLESVDVFPAERLDLARDRATMLADPAGSLAVRTRSSDSFADLPTNAVAEVGAFGDVPAEVAALPFVEQPGWNGVVRHRLTMLESLNGGTPAVSVRADARVEDNRRMVASVADGRDAVFAYGASVRQMAADAVAAGISPPNPLRLVRVLAVDGDHRCVAFECQLGVGDYVAVHEIDADGAFARDAYFDVDQFDQGFATFRAWNEESAGWTP